MSTVVTGTVKWFKNDKGYGFIVNESGEDVFVHYRAIMAEGFKTLRDGEKVEFIQVKSEKGWQAAEVERVEMVAERDVGTLGTSLPMSHENQR